jgi:hypothetical protein
LVISLRPDIAERVLGHAIPHLGQEELRLSELFFDVKHHGRNPFDTCFGLFITVMVPVVDAFDTRYQEQRAFGDKEPFDFYLSAFLNAARTVDYRLRHEQPAYAAWRVWNATHGNEDDLIKFLVMIDVSRSTKAVLPGSCRARSSDWARAPPMPMPRESSKCL